jgi:tripartite-type tricarboxylate transporter receptor subunit TctC
MNGLKIAAVLAGLSLFPAFPLPGLGQEFPNKPIRMIVPYSAGGGTDILGRAFQRPLEKELKVKILIENIPAGSTKVGTLEGMKARPDGYTLLLMPSQSWVAYYYSKTYDSRVWEKLTPIGNLTSEPYGFIEVLADSPYKTWADLVKAAKDHPGKLTCGGPGAGGILEILFLEITKAAGIQCKYVPFAGAGPTKIALLGGHIDFRICQPTESIAMIRAGKTRGLAVSTEKRFGPLPDVPTFKDLGIGEAMTLTRGIWGPPGMRPQQVQVLSRGIEKGTKDPDFVKLVEEELVYKVEFKTGPAMQKEILDFDKELGPKFEAMTK